LLQQNAVANLAGLGTGMRGNSAQQLALYIAESNSFLDAIADELKIVEKYKIRKFLKTNSRKVVKGLIKVKMDEKSGVFSLAATHIDPIFAQQVVLTAVAYYEKRFAELGLDKRGPKSIIAPIPINKSKGNASEDSIPIWNNHSIIPVT